MSETPSFDELYDADTLEAIEAWARQRVQAPERAVPGDAPDATDIDPVGRRDPRTLGFGGSLLAAALFGLADAIEPKRPDEETVEERPTGSARDDQPVTFLYAPDPAASRIIVRPWLFDT